MSNFYNIKVQDSKKILNFNDTIVDCHELIIPNGITHIFSSNNFYDNEKTFENVTTIKIPMV